MIKTNFSYLGARNANSTVKTKQKNIDGGGAEVTKNN